MNIQKALDTADEMKPNMMSRALKISFLTEIEQLFHQEILMKHWHSPLQTTIPEYTEDTDAGTEMLIPDPYSMVYVYWLMTKIDLQNLEMDKYNADRMLFDNQWETMSDWWTRNHMPITMGLEYRL